MRQLQALKNHDWSLPADHHEDSVADPSLDAEDEDAESASQASVKGEQHEEEQHGRGVGGEAHPGEAAHARC
eukprot:3034229-Rhodomonas_salina.1